MPPHRYYDYGHRPILLAPTPRTILVRPVIDSTYHNREYEPLSIHGALGEQLSFSVPLEYGLMQLVEDGDVSHKSRKLYTWIFVVECIRIISMWTSIDTEFPKDSKGSGFLRDRAHLRTADEGGSLKRIENWAGEAGGYSPN